jgi:HSP20 family molecular chaperone IbpA
MSRVPSLSSPFLLGFDEIERALDRVVKGADGYPPYNIERCDRNNGQPERLRITLAVAGFTRDQLDVTIEENQPLPAHFRAGGGDAGAGRGPEKRAVVDRPCQARA